MDIRIRGNATVEASITLPVFLMAVLAVVSLMQYPITHRQVGSAMSDVARMLSAGGYLAVLSGMQGVGNEVDRIAEQGFVIGGDKLNEVTDALASLANDPASETDSNGDSEERNSKEPMQPIGMTDAYKALSRTLTSGVGKWVGSVSNDALNDLVLKLSTDRLKQSGRNSQSDVDPWRKMGIKNGEKGVDLSNSRYYSEDGSIELVAVYTVKPVSLFGVAPAVQCCNRIRVMSWGVGVGPSLRKPLIQEQEGSTDDSSEISLWNMGNDSSQLWQRGKAIEEAELEKMENIISGNGVALTRADARQSGYDAVSVGMDINRVTVYQIISVNPFLASYHENIPALKGLIREHVNRMPAMGSEIKAGSSTLPFHVGAGRLIIIVPVNAPVWLDEAIGESRADLAAMGITLELIRGYGTYDGPGTEPLGGNDEVIDLNP